MLNLEIILSVTLIFHNPQTMYANFVVSGSAQDVQVHRDIQVQVHKELEPPYEELFDAVEEHVLHSLLEPWQMHVDQEKSLFNAEVRLKTLITVLIRCISCYSYFSQRYIAPFFLAHYL